MSEHDTHMTAEAGDAVEADDGQAKQLAEQTERTPLWMRVLKWTAISLASLIAFAVFAAVMLYNFGGMWGSVYPELGPQYQELVASGQAPALRTRFVIPIPGCKCHSTDPVLTAQHSKRHMNECGKCHNTNPAHMEPGVL